MPGLVRINPETPCPPDGAHHPHLLVCDDYEDNCWDDLEDGRGYMQYHELSCCIDGQEWPCETKKEHIAERRAEHGLPPVKCICSYWSVNRRFGKHDAKCLALNEKGD